MTKQQKIRARQELCLELPRIEQRLMQSGLYKTARKLNTAVQEIGWESAALMERKK